MEQSEQKAQKEIAKIQEWVEHVKRDVEILSAPTSPVATTKSEIESRIQKLEVC